MIGVLLEKIISCEGKKRHQRKNTTKKSIIDPRALNISVNQKKNNILLCDLEGKQNNKKQEFHMCYLELWGKINKTLFLSEPVTNYQMHLLGKIVLNYVAIRKPIEIVLLTTIYIVKYKDGLEIHTLI